MTWFKDYRVGHIDEPYCIGSKLCLLTCWHLTGLALPGLTLDKGSIDT